MNLNEMNQQFYKGVRHAMFRTDKGKARYPIASRTKVRKIFSAQPADPGGLLHNQSRHLTALWELLSASWC